MNQPAPRSVEASPREESSWISRAHDRDDESRPERRVGDGNRPESSGSPTAVKNASSPIASIRSGRIAGAITSESSAVDRVKRTKADGDHR